jgi:hypothetical protein
MRLEEVFDAGVVVEYADATGRWTLTDGQWVSQPLTASESRILAAMESSAAIDAALTECRTSLTDAVQLAALSPYPTPEEQAIIDAQVSASLALFRALSDPPADVTALAAAVLTLEVQR